MNGDGHLRAIPPGIDTTVVSALAAQELMPWVLESPKRVGVKDHRSNRSKVCGTPRENAGDSPSGIPDGSTWCGKLNGGLSKTNDRAPRIIRPTAIRKAGLIKVKTFPHPMAEPSRLFC
jgi:hypothetical protein